MKTPYSVCWNITSRCNDKCLFCYRERNSSELDFERQKRIIDRIARSGIYKVTYSGGEPLLVPRIRELILYAKEQGLKVSMTTNGILLEEEMLDFSMGTLDWLSFSLDGAATEVQQAMGRNQNHVERTKRLLDRIQERKDRTCRVKINTVVSQVNKEFIADIGDFIFQYPINRWKLFQFVPLRGEAWRNAKDFYISDECFWDTIDSVKRHLGEREKLLTISGRENIENAYFVIFPDGAVMISTGLEDRIIGNALYDDLGELWQREPFGYQLHEERTRCIRQIKGDD